MLEKIKNYSETWISKILLFAIGASFVFWGISGNMMTNSNTALKVGNKQISAIELESELKRQIAQMQMAMGNINFNYQQAISMGLLEQVINNMTYRLLLDAEAKNQGIYVSNNKIYEIIKNTKEFQDKDGKFSAEQFAYILNANNTTETEFVSEIANNIARELLVNSIVSDINTDNIAKLLYQQKNEERIIDVVQFDIDKEKITSTPKDEELKELYQLNINNFAQPEYRKISYIIIDSDSAKKYKEINDEDTDKLYKTMIEIGENIIDEINGGSNIDEIVKSFNVKKTSLPDINTDGKTRQGTTLKDKNFTQKYIDIAFFALDEKGISDVLDNKDNIMLIYVEKVFAPSPKQFESVKPELTKMWKHNMQISSANEKATKILENLNKGEKFSTAVINVDSSANTALFAKTKRFNNLYDTNFLTKVFVEDVNKPFMVKSNDTYYVAQVKDVILPEIKTSDKEDFEKFKQSVKQTTSENILDEYIQYLYKKHGVKRNEKVIERFYK